MVEKVANTGDNGGGALMESLNSILPYLPVVLRSSSLFWPPQVMEALKALSRGPHHSNVNSGELLSLAITDMRRSLNYSSRSFSASAVHGYTHFFDDLMSRDESARWFQDTLPRMAGLLLNLPAMLESHYKENGSGTTCLRLLESQQPGFVLLSQELIAALLSCAFFALFPEANRGAKYLPTINLHRLFAHLYECYEENQESKIKCIIHYFERVCSSMPKGSVSFERKVLPCEKKANGIPYPSPAFWSKSNVTLCSFQVHSSGLIEDQKHEALEVDFANEYLGGGALSRGCVQEEIRFMINPELIVGMLFTPSMEYNEAIEIIGAERFSSYSGYASTFRFCGDYVDSKNADPLGRLKTRIIAIDALCYPGRKQFGSECLVREINKAFCGFLYQSKYKQYKQLFKDEEHLGGIIMPSEGPSSSSRGTDGASGQFGINACHDLQQEEEIGIATGNWGCGAFGGDPEVKAMIQWLAASQALRPFISYYTFNLETLKILDQVVDWITFHEWTVGELWNMLVEYGRQRLAGETRVGFFLWLLPSL